METKIQIENREFYVTNLGGTGGCLFYVLKNVLNNAAVIQFDKKLCNLSLIDRKVLRSKLFLGYVYFSSVRSLIGTIFFAIFTPTYDFR